MIWQNYINSDFQKKIKIKIEAYKFFLKWSPIGLDKPNCSEIKVLILGFQS